MKCSPIGKQKMDSLEVIKKLEKTYSGKWLNNIYKNVGIVEIEHQEFFRKRLVSIGKDYIQYLHNTKSITTLTQRKRRLKSFANALDIAVSEHKKLYQDRMASVDFDYSLTALADSKKMSPLALDSIVNEFRTIEEIDGGYGGHDIGQLLSFIKEAAENALLDPSADYLKSGQESKIVRYWVAMIGLTWPKDAKLNFSTGRYYKELGRYKSQTIDVLHELFIKIQPDATIQNISSALKYVQDTKLKNPAVYLVHE